MAGTPIRRAFIARIQAKGGVGMILDRIANGEKLPELAQGLGVSRPFLGDYLRTLPGGRAAVQIARRIAAESAARASLEQWESKLRAAGRGASDAMIWLQTRGGFRQAAGSEPGANPATTAAYVSERELDLGRQHLDSMRRAAERDRSPRPDFPISAT